jgi:hypothetical protein
MTFDLPILKKSANYSKCDADQTSSNGEDCSVATKTASDAKLHADSLSEQDNGDDMIYVPYEY